MTVVQLDIPDNMKIKIGLQQGNHINIVELFGLFGIDIDYVLRERKYSQDFLKDIKNNDFVVSNHF